MNRHPESESLHDVRGACLATVLAAALGWGAVGCSTTPPPEAAQKASKAAQAPPPSSSQSPAPAPSGAAAPAASGDAAAIAPDQLDSLVAPIALYPDPLLAQVLAAATYPVELVELQQWLAKNSTLKGQALADAVAKQSWDASVQGLANFPDVVKRLTDDIQWTTDVGNAFLAQQQDVMDAVQRMRAKAQKNGNLKTTEQQMVETKQIENQQVIVIEQADPQTVYVPSYNPTAVYGPPVYPYPPIYYPPPPPYGAMAVSFTFGIAMGAMMSGGWGYGCGWGHSSTVVINTNNFYVNKQNVRTGGGANNWQHNPKHRGGTPYPNQRTAGRYGGGSGAAAGRGGAGATTRPSGGGADRIGTQDVSRGGGQSRGAFGGGSSGGYNGSRANASSARGSSSMGSRGGGGRGGGGRRR